MGIVSHPLVLELGWSDVVVANLAGGGKTSIASGAVARACRRSGPLTKHGRPVRARAGAHCMYAPLILSNRLVLFHLPCPLVYVLCIIPTATSAPILDVDRFAGTRRASLNTSTLHMHSFARSIPRSRRLTTLLLVLDLVTPTRTTPEQATPLPVLLKIIAWVLPVSTRRKILIYDSSIILDL
ncbi:hypothetical protein OH77DRAFT_1321776 [Trametes cingulata]|nr:hypothetical protein OH77DRAFT_1321776 [Trametes cingulata]